MTKQPANISNEPDVQVADVSSLAKASRQKNRPSNSNLSGGILVTSNEVTSGPQGITDQHNFISLINNSNAGFNGSSTVAATTSQIYLP